MFSIKDAVRKTVVAVSLAALTTSFFTGCSQQPTVSDVDLYPPSITTEVSTPYTEELTDDINPGINDETHDANTFSIKYKYWYDNPDVKETQDKALAEADPGGDNPNGETFLGIPGLPLYTDPSGNQYIISGRTVCYLADGKLASKDMYNLLRKTGTGERIYYGLTQTAEDILSTFLKRSAGKEQPATYEDRKAQDAEATLNSATYAIYVNNIETGMTTTPDGMIEVSSVLPSYGVANYASDEQALYLHTAAVSNLKLEFKTEADTITIEYSTGEKDENISTKEIILAGDMLKMSPEAKRMKEKKILKGDAAVVTVMSNLGFHDFMKQNGMKTVCAKVGDRYVLEEMQRSGYNIGGEQSGHIIMLDHATTGDGQLTAAMLIKVMTETGKSLAQLCEGIEDYPQLLVNVKITESGKGKWNNVPAIMDCISAAEKELGGSGRVLVRESGTEPLVRVMVEGKDMDMVKRLADSIAEEVKRSLT